MPVIKKYENRRLYDTSTSKYVNLEELAALIASGADVSVVDAKSGKDLTGEVLLQIVVEGDPSVAPLPPALLRRIIRARGDSATARLAREQLVLGLELLEAQLAQAEAWVARLEEPMPEPEPAQWAEEPGSSLAAWRAPGQGQAELDALRVELTRLEERLTRR
jgi:polyhydroxyalkanoate synthesis repressor PhaR